MSKFQQLMSVSPEWRKIIVKNSVVLTLIIVLLGLSALKAFFVCVVFAMLHFIIMFTMQAYPAKWTTKTRTLTAEDIIKECLITLSWLILAWFCIIIEAIQQSG